jgi:hypothetical protein
MVDRSLLSLGMLSRGGVRRRKQSFRCGPTIADEDSIVIGLLSGLPLSLAKSTGMSGVGWVDKGRSQGPRGTRIWESRS